jgi:phosphatidylserine/phosphatidylglycerophosphate/cardiolipin synthase-like enzyme
MSQKKSIPVLLLSLVLITACISLTPTTLPPVPTSTTGPEVSTSDWIRVHFSNPDDPQAGSYRGGPDDALAAAIDEARFSVDAAIYHLDLWSIRDALLAAHQRGVTVRITTESDNLDEAEMQELVDAGIPVVSDRRESLMHNKFVVIDNYEIWTGSMNFTVNGAYKNDNNLVQMRSSRLAENFLSEFNEMFADDFFGDYVVKNTPNSSLTIEGSRVDTYFSPDDGTAKMIVDLIRGAEQNIHFMAFSFTSDEIAQALIEVANQGVSVSGIFEESQYRSNTGTEFDNLHQAGLDVHLDGNNRNMHHKVFIIDEQIVITGSYNFSRSAEERNDENTLVLYNPEVANWFLEEFERVYEKAVRE